MLVMQKGSRSAQDRTMVVACLAEVAQDMGAPIAAYVDVLFCDCIFFSHGNLYMALLFINSFFYLMKYGIMFQAVMPLVLKELSSSSENNRRNAAFCIGEFCKNGGVSSLKYSSTFHLLICFSDVSFLTLEVAISTHLFMNGSVRVMFDL